VHSKRPELVDFLTGIAEVSDKLSFDEQDTQGLLRSPISFMLKTSGAPNGIMFSGIPSGHEFNSLILAILQSGGSELRLDEGIKTIIGGIQEELNFEVFVSLSCHNCPDIVQALNQFALINPNISNEMIDGGLFQELINERDIQGVPSVGRGASPERPIKPLAAGWERRHRHDQATLSGEVDRLRHRW
jgi:alkyl hydroperoxide reductase subunit F